MYTWLYIWPYTMPLFRFLHWRRRCFSKTPQLQCIEVSNLRFCGLALPTVRQLGGSVHQDYIVWHWTFLFSYDDDKWPTSPFRFAITPSWRVYGNKLCLAGFTSHQGFSFCYISYSWLVSMSWWILTVYSFSHMTDKNSGRRQ